MSFEFPQSTNFNQFPDIARGGQDYGLAEDPTGVRTAHAEVAVDPGLFVVTGTDTAEGAVLPGSAADITNKLMGVVRYREAIEPQSPIFPVGSPLGVRRRGVIYVLCDGDVVDGAVPYIVFDTTGGHTLGAVRADAGAGTVAGVAPSGVRVRYGALAGAFAAVEVNLP